MKCPTCGDLRAEFFSVNFWTCPTCDAPKQATSAPEKADTGHGWTALIYPIGDISVDERSTKGLNGKSVSVSRHGVPYRYDVVGVMDYNWIFIEPNGTIIQSGVVRHDPFAFIAQPPLGSKNVFIDHDRKVIELKR